MIIKNREIKLMYSTLRKPCWTIQVYLNQVEFYSAVIWTFILKYSRYSLTVLTYFVDFFDPEAFRLVLFVWIFISVTFVTFGLAWTDTNFPHIQLFMYVLCTTELCSNKTSSQRVLWLKIISSMLPSCMFLCSQVYSSRNMLVLLFSFCKRDLFIIVHIILL